MIRYATCSLWWEANQYGSLDSRMPHSSVLAIFRMTRSGTMTHTREHRPVKKCPTVAALLRATDTVATFGLTLINRGFRNLGLRVCFGTQKCCNWTLALVNIGITVRNLWISERATTGVHCRVECSRQSQTLPITPLGQMVKTCFAFFWASQRHSEISSLQVF